MEGQNKKATTKEKKVLSEEARVLKRHAEQNQAR